MTGGYVLGALANSLVRVQNLDLLVLSGMFVVLMNSHVDKKQLVLVLLGLLTSLVYELAFLAIHLQHLGRQPDMMSLVEGGSLGLLTLLLSLAMFLYKMVAVAVYGRYYQTYSSQYESLYPYQK